MREPFLEFEVTQSIFTACHVSSLFRCILCLRWKQVRNGSSPRERIKTQQSGILDLYLLHSKVFLKLVTMEDIMEENFIWNLSVNISHMSLGWCHSIPEGHIQNKTIQLINE